MGALTDGDHPDHAAWFGAVLTLRLEMFKKIGCGMERVRIR
jgi:hypothetical protein